MDDGAVWGRFSLNVLYHIRDDQRTREAPAKEARQAK